MSCASLAYPLLFGARVKGERKGRETGRKWKFIFAIQWGINGWAQSMGVPPSIVALLQWYDDRHRGTFYGFTYALWFWIIAAVLSVLLVTIVWHKACWKNARV